MTDIPPVWVLIEAANRSGLELDEYSHIQDLRSTYNCENTYLGAKGYRALCDMIQKYEQPPIDLNLLCEVGTRMCGYEGHDEDCEIMLKGVLGDSTRCDCGYEDIWKAWSEALGETECCN